LLFDYKPTELQVSYNIKWTILHHIKYIVNRVKLFDNLYPDGLDGTHFYDALSQEYKNLPAFGIDYLGKRVVGAELEDLFLIRYVGMNVQIIPENRFGIVTDNRTLLTLHDLLYYNFEKLSRNNSLIMYTFEHDKLDPNLTQIGFSMELLDSIPSRDEKTHARVNQFEMTYGVVINT
jgi:hypothetical protein